jgi:hypothetical protein
MSVITKFMLALMALCFLSTVVNAENAGDGRRARCFGSTGDGTGFDYHHCPNCHGFVSDSTLLLSSSICILDQIPVRMTDILRCPTISPPSATPRTPSPVPPSTGAHSKSSTGAKTNPSTSPNAPTNAGATSRNSSAEDGTVAATRTSPGTASVAIPRTAVSRAPRTPSMRRECASVLTVETRSSQSLFLHFRLGLVGVLIGLELLRRTPCAQVGCVNVLLGRD